MSPAANSDEEWFHRSLLHFGLVMWIMPAALAVLAAGFALEPEIAAFLPAWIRFPVALAGLYAIWRVVMWQRIWILRNYVGVNRDGVFPRSICRTRVPWSAMTEVVEVFHSGEPLDSHYVHLRTPEAARYTIGGGAHIIIPCWPIARKRRGETGGASLVGAIRRFRPVRTVASNAEI